jgi:hypothetical protein
MSLPHAVHEHEAAPKWVRVKYRLKVLSETGLSSQLVRSLPASRLSDEVSNFHFFQMMPFLDEAMVHRNSFALDMNYDGVKVALYEWIEPM